MWSKSVLLDLIKEAQQTPWPMELETKILNVDIVTVQKRLTELKAQLVKPEHLLLDYRFKRQAQSTLLKGPVEFDLRTIVATPDNARHFFQACALLGWRVSDIAGYRITLLPHNPAALSGRSVRLRYDGHQWTLTVKQELERDEQLVRRTEVTVDLRDPDVVRTWLVALAYRQSSRREKKNTVYRLGTAAVELRQAPLVPPLVEIEATKKDEIYKAMTELGLNRSQATSISDAEYLRAYLPPEEQSAIDDLRFTHAQSGV